MKVLEELKALFPIYIIDESSLVSIEEKGAQAKLKTLRLKNEQFWNVENKIIQDFAGFFKKARSSSFFHKDCDGIVFVESDGKQYLIFIELKSGFASDKMVLAKKQLVSSYIKLNTLLNMCKSFCKEDLTMLGVIASLKPDTEDEMWLNNIIMLDETSTERRNAQLAFDFYTKGKSVVTKESCTELNGLNLSNACMFDELPIYYLPAEDRTIELDVKRFLNEII